MLIIILIEISVLFFSRGKINKEPEIYNSFIDNKGKLIKVPVNNQESKYSDNEIINDLITTVKKIRKDSNTNAYLLLEYEGVVDWLEEKPTRNGFYLSIKMSNNQVEFFFFQKDQILKKDIKKGDRVFIVFKYSFFDSSKAVEKDIIKLN